MTSQFLPFRSFSCFLFLFCSVSDDTHRWWFATCRVI
jgi:hypothetical protein